MKNIELNKDRFYMFFLYLIAIFVHQSSIMFNVNFSLSDIFILIFFMYSVFIYKECYRLSHLIVLFSIISIYILNGCLIIPNNLNFDISYIKVLSEILKIMILFLFFELGILLRQRGYNGFIKVYSYSVAYIILFSLSVKIFKISPLLDIFYYGGNRMRGLLEDPNYFSIMSLTALPYFINKDIIFRKKMVYILLISTGIILSGSKTGFISLFLYFIYKGFSAMFLKGNNVIKISLLTVVLAIIILINYGRIYSIMSNLSIKFPAINRVSYIFNDVGYALIGDGSSRSVAWSNGLKIIQIFPILGVGRGNNSKVAMKLFSNPTISHNTYIQILVDWGIILGILFLSILIVKSIYNFKSSINKDNINNRLVYEIFLILLIGSLAISLDNSRILRFAIGYLFFYD